MFLTEKRWQFVAIAGEAGTLAAAVANLGYLGLGFCYAHDRKTGVTRRFEVKTPLSLGALVAEAPQSGFSRLSVPQGLILLEPHRLEIRSAEVQARMDLALAAPFEARWRLPSGGEQHTRKRMGGRGSGHVSGPGLDLDLSGGILYDWSCGRPERETRWRWCAGVGLLGSQPVAWNLRTGFDDESQAENAVWLAGMPEPAGPCTIAPGEGLGPWAIAAGPLALTFHPEGEQREDVDLGLAASRYRQPWGRFEGTLGGQPLRGFGVVEDHWARW